MKEYEERQRSYDEIAALIKGYERKDIEAFYTGGGIWLCGVYLSDTIYAVTSNVEPTTLTYYDAELDEEYNFPLDEYGGYPCYAWIRSVGESSLYEDDTEITDEDRALLNELQDALKAEMTRCGD